MTRRPAAVEVLHQQRLGHEARELLRQHGITVRDEPSVRPFGEFHKFNKGVDRWARWFGIMDRLPNWIVRIIPGRLK